MCEVSLYAPLTPMVIFGYKEENMIASGTEAESTTPGKTDTALNQMVSWAHSLQTVKLHHLH